LSQNECNVRSHRFIITFATAILYFSKTRNLTFSAFCESIFLGRYLNLDVSFVHRKSNSILIFLKEDKSDTEIPPGIRKNFGTLDYTFKEIKSRPDFWTTLVERYMLHRYERINLNKDVFEFSFQVESRI
jgi:hypothetical protein